MALSHRPAEIAGVVEALMRHDALSGGSVEAGGDGLRATRPRATRRLRPRAIRRTYPLPRPSRESLERDGDGDPYRGLPWGASREVEFVSGCRDLLLEARGEEEEDPVGSVVAGEGPTAYLLALFF